MSSTEKPVRIREATVEDMPTLAKLLEELAQATGHLHKFVATSDSYAEHGFGDRPLFEALIASVNDEPVGAAVYFYTFSTWYGEPGVYLQDIVVTEASRGLGVGLALIRRVAQKARSGGATHLRLAVDRANDVAMAFYDQVGLRRADEDVLYAIDGEAFAALASGLRSGTRDDGPV